MTCLNFLTRNNDIIYKPSDINYIINQIKPHIKTTSKYDYKTKSYYKIYNIGCAFDIETTSFYWFSEKRATMYLWTFCIYGFTVAGRTWKEFLDMLSIIQNELYISRRLQLHIYVHNLAFDFQFFRKYFNFPEPEDVFALQNRKIIYALTEQGFKFRCSYLLSGYNLDTLAKNLTSYKIKKLVGDLDYNLIRHSYTPLTQKELDYAANDVKIIVVYIEEQIKSCGDISLIPNTNTGFVRNFCRGKCLPEHKKIVDPAQKKKRYDYRKLMKSLTITVDEYKQLKKCFQGGFTHANPQAVGEFKRDTKGDLIFTGKTFQNVTSYDFTSSYPTQMIVEKYPMGPAEHITITGLQDLENNCKKYCCSFTIEYVDIEEQFYFEHGLSISRCEKTKGAIADNGRIVFADYAKTTITDVDYFIYKKLYKYKSIRITNFIRYKKEYLPTEFVECILELYEKKTTLKGVAGYVEEYLKSKGMLNSCYGMAVTDILRDIIRYENGDWLEPLAPDAEEVIEKYNNNYNRFLFYSWGVWVTAYARRALFSGILEFGEDYLYSDTDSIKVLNADKHIDYINRYNNMIIKALERAMIHHGLPVDKIRPKNRKGEEKPLGVWDFDGHYSYFKTLGAKRYLVKYSDDPRNGDDAGIYKITVAGLSKQKAVEYLKFKAAMSNKFNNKHTYKITNKTLKTTQTNKTDIKNKIENTICNNIFNIFCDDLTVPAWATGKLTHTYIDSAISGDIADYLGNTAHYSELSYIHLEPAEYNLGLAGEYIDYLAGIETVIL